MRTNCQFYPAQKNNQNFEQMDILKLYKDSTELDKRSITLDKQNKWNVFRDIRTKVIDRYIFCKKMQHRLQTTLQFLFLRQILRKLSKNFKTKQRIYERKIKGKFCVLVIANRWLRLRRRFAPDFPQIIRNNIRKSFSLVSVTYEAKYQKSL